MDILVDDFCTGQLIDGQPQAIPGYFVRSTAPINIEEDEQKTDDILPTINDVVESLYQHSQLNDSYTGLVIQIHGYNTGTKKVMQNGQAVDGPDYVRLGWTDICHYLNQRDQSLFGKPNSFVYVGYRWPSEAVPSNFAAADTALPIILKWMFRGGLVMAAVGLLLLLLFPSHLMNAGAALLLAIGVALAMLVGSLFILRIIVYFRDAYRASNFGAPDLVEFIRQVDQGLMRRVMNAAFFRAVQDAVAANTTIDASVLAKAVCKTWEVIENRQELLQERNDDKFRELLPLLKQRNLAQLDDAVFLQIYASCVSIEKPTLDAATFKAAEDYWQSRRIRLTFIGHSMGGFVTTETVRILSDAFDPRAIGNSVSLEKTPPSSIGRVFCLGRLVLVSPDIPLKTIISGRTNFLRSSLRRFEEAYLFSNEGDLALRLASTAANYFSFPASTRTQGFRLGNVTVNLPDRNLYGIVNFEQMSSSKVDHLLQYIGVQVLNRDDRSLRRDALKKQKGAVDNESLATAKPDPESIADLFTYLDCTEYRDQTDYPGRANQLMNVLICDKQRSPLQFFDYVKLLKAYVDFSGNMSTGIDVHGGYFYGHFSKLLIYRLAFLGFPGLLDAIVAQPPEDFGLKAPPPALQAKLAQVAPLTLEDRRRVALEYFSWLCEQKRIQVAASQERYYVDILGLDRGEVRAGILTREKKTDPSVTV